MQRVPTSAARLAGILLAVTGLATATAPGSQAPSSLEELVRAHRHPIHEEAGGLGGPGLELLVREGREAEFFLIGESHLTAEIPVLATRLALELRDAGYGALAVETGPLSTRWMVDAVRAGGPDRLAEIVARYPFTLPFFEGRPEAEMLETALDAGYEVWGLDQEFVGSGRYWLDRLQALAPDEDARRTVAEWQRREAEAARHYRETGSTERALLLTASGEDLDGLRDALRDAPEAVEIVDALAASARIYQLWRPRNYENNRQRIAYMKANLVDRLQRHEEPPKVLMKFGSVHMGKGLTPVNQLDLGNLAHEAAILRGGRSLHLWATGMARRGADGSLSDWTSSNPDWAVLYEQVDPEAAWTLFDLRPLRPWFHRQANREAAPGLSDAAFRYDLLAISPELHAAPQMTSSP